jgi:4-diphosphocytidyl-2-C-methyl-D-erythritol kinase
MVALDIADIVTITDASSTQISLDGPFADGIPTDESNLVHKALALAGRTAHVHITKNIPHGGGLGGGSTDAAAILRWANFTDTTAAARVGADLAFSLTGGRARVHVSTPLVYSTWDGIGGPRGDNGNDLEPAALAAVPELSVWRQRIADTLGYAPFLAGSGATWFVNGHVPLSSEGLDGLRVVHTTTRPDAGRVV